MKLELLGTYRQMQIETKTKAFSQVLLCQSTHLFLKIISRSSRHLFLNCDIRVYVSVDKNETKSEEILRLFFTRR